VNETSLRNWVKLHLAEEARQAHPLSVSPSEFEELEEAIRSWASTWNDNPRPLVWHKTADEILDSLASYCSADL
jgi:hypothetical protein